MYIFFFLSLAFKTGLFYIFAMENQYGSICFHISKHKEKKLYKAIMSLPLKFILVQLTNIFNFFTTK